MTGGACDGTDRWQQVRAAGVDGAALVADLQQQLAEIVAASESSNADDEHDPEGATIAFERAQIAALLHQARQSGLEVEEALERLAKGTYGWCVSCGRAIGAARLDARPEAGTCIACASGGHSAGARNRGRGLK